jgi:hypothetical protein
MFMFAASFANAEGERQQKRSVEQQQNYDREFEPSEPTRTISLYAAS